LSGKQSVSRRPMDIFYLPYLSEPEFEVLDAGMRTRLIYSDWLEMVAAWSKEAAAAGCLVRSVPVEPEEFRQYLDARGFPPDWAQLLGFAEWVGRREKG
jgi:hypothetical protein